MRMRYCAHWRIMQMTKGKIPHGAGSKIRAVLRRVKEQESEIREVAKVRARELVQKARELEDQQEVTENPKAGE